MSGGGGVAVPEPSVISSARVVPVSTLHAHAHRLWELHRPASFRLTRVTGGVCGPDLRAGAPLRPARPQLAGDTELMLKSGTRSGGIAVRVNQSFHSRGSVRSVRPACTVRPSRSTGDSLNRKLFTAPVTSPPSTRKTPSRVR